MGNICSSLGCCGTIAPDVIIPDPENGQTHNVMFEKTGVFADDQYVYQDGDKEKKWLFMDKKGGLFSNPIYILENFVRDENGKGEVLCAARVYCKEFDRYKKGTKHDSDDSNYSDSTDGRKIKYVTKAKWKQCYHVVFYSDRGMQNQIGEIKCKAKGKGKLTRIKRKDQDGNVTWRREVWRVRFELVGFVIGLVRWFTDRLVC